GMKGSFMCIQLANPEAVLLEHCDGARHVADLVAAPSERDLGAEMAARQDTHVFGDTTDRLCQRFRAEESGAEKSNHHEKSTGERCGFHRIEGHVRSCGGCCRTALC